MRHDPPDDLLLLHETLAAAERGGTLAERLGILANAIRQLGFLRVLVTVHDEALNTISTTMAGVAPDDEREVRAAQAGGMEWRARLASPGWDRTSRSCLVPRAEPWLATTFAGAPGGDVLLVPLDGSAGGVVAVLLLELPAGAPPPSPARVRTVELFGRHVAGFVDQAALVALGERRSRWRRTLHETGALLARSLDESTILRALARELERLLPAAEVAVFTADAGGGLTARQLWRRGTEWPAAQVSAPLQGVAWEAATSRRVVRPADAAMVGVPALLAGSLIAVIAATARVGATLHEDDVELLTALAAQTAAAVTNARAYDESLRQRRQTEALAEIARAVGESLRLDQVLRLILRHATALLRTEGAAAGLLRDGDLEIIAGVGSGERIIGHRLPMTGSMSGRAVRTGSVVIGDVATDPEAFPPVMAAAHIHNVVIVPLASTAGVVGGLGVFNRAEPFTQEDGEVLQRLADQVAVAVVNARLFEELADATREWSVAFDAIGTGMVRLDRDGRILRINARGRQLSGVPDDEAAAGRQLHALLFGDHAPCGACVHLATIGDGVLRKGVHADEPRGRLFELTASPHPAGGAVVTFDDVTEHRALAERQRLVVEATRDAIVITDRERRIAFANPAAIAMFGFGDALIGLPVSRTSAREFRDSVREHEDRAFAGEPQRYESVVERADGDRRIVAITTAPLYELGKVSGVVASLRDVTEERRARDAVVLSEARYRNVFDSATDSIYTLDSRGAFTSVNDATLQMTGRTRGDLLGHSARGLVLEEELAYVGERFLEALAGASLRYECHFRRADGERRLVSVNNSPIRRGPEIVGVLGVARDITDERGRAVALARSEARYSRLVESASDAIFTIDREGRFTAVNHSLAQAVGRSREALLGRQFAELVDRRDLQVARDLLAATFGGQRRRSSLRYHDAHGEVRHGSVITSPVVDDDGLTGALGIMRDVTDERRLAEQMLQQEKLAAVGQLVSGVAHELNNPLAGVMAFAELLAARPAEDEQAALAVETIHREATRAARIVRHLLTFARQQPSDRAAVDLNAIVRDSVALRQGALQDARIAVSLQLDPALPSTWADPFQLQQVVLNLLGNAEHAVSSQPAGRAITIRTARRRGTLRLAVSDTGPGIAPERLDRIFNPFYTTKPVGQGTGLGLSISDGIVREHGGRITAESAPGEGATFIVELPVTAPTPVERGGEHPVPAPPATGRALVVDDESAMRTAISSFLRLEGHLVDVAASTSEARAFLGAGEYDVILLDLRMPGEGGEQLFDELRRRDPRHADRVVFVTGDFQDAGVQRFLAAANRPLVTKPFQLDDLSAVVAAAMH
jgi:PAS domain S-box-containing protein